MGFIKTNRLNQRCGDCKYFDKDNNYCLKPEMEKIKVTVDDTIYKCDDKYFVSKDDYETSGR